MMWIARLLTVVAAIVAGAPLGVILVQLVCTNPLVHYCGGHEHAASVYLAFWAVASLALWPVFSRLLNRWRLARSPVFRADEAMSSKAAAEASIPSASRERRP